MVAGLGPGEQGVSPGGRHRGHRIGGHRSHRGCRHHAHHHVEGVCRDPRQERVRKVREGAQGGSLGRGDQSYLQTSNVNIQESNLQRKNVDRTMQQALMC